MGESVDKIRGECISDLNMIDFPSSFQSKSFFLTRGEKNGMEMNNEVAFGGSRQGIL